MKIAAAALATAACVAPAQAQLQVQMHLVDATGVGKSIGTITLTDSAGGLMLEPALEGLPPGLHGFHVHENPSCDPATDPDKGKVMPAQAAGGHLDPHKSGQHQGPMRDGHLGDLPALRVDGSGKATSPVLAPRLKLANVTARALVIHAGGDNYSDKPEKLGGGGERIACGVIGS